MSEKEFIVLGKHLKIIRKYICKGAPKSQHEYARELGWTQKSFSLIENASEDPIPKKLQVLFDKSNVTEMLIRHLSKESEES